LSLNIFQNLSRTIYYNTRTKTHKHKLTIKIPFIWYLTDDLKSKNQNLIINNLPKNSGIIIRKYDKKYKYKNIKNLVKISRKKSLFTLVAGNIDQFQFIQGNHIPKWLHKKSKNQKIISISIHGLKDIRKCINLKADIAFISPVFNTTSHVNKNFLGTVKLGLISRKFKIPIIALGGINEKNIKLLKSIPIHGCAGVDIFEKYI